MYQNVLHDTFSVKCQAAVPGRDFRTISLNPIWLCLAFRAEVAWGRLVDANRLGQSNRDLFVSFLVYAN